MSKSETTSIGNLTYELSMDTGRAIRKLRAMAKHFQALADELDEIDREIDREAEQASDD